MDMSDSVTKAAKTFIKHMNVNYTLGQILKIARDEQHDYGLSDDVADEIIFQIEKGAI